MDAINLQGIVPPLVTPLRNYDSLDEAGLERLLEHVIAGGVAGVFILGTTGEAPSLSYRLRREMISATCRIVSRRIPVLVGVTDTAFVESVALAQHAQSVGADAVVLSTPYYFPAGQTELIQYVTRIMKQLPLPLMLYNMPSLTKVWFEIDSLRHMAEQPNIIGVKDSSGDLSYFGELIGLKAVRQDWQVLIGPEHLLPEAMRLGGDGGVNGGANCFPALFCELHRALASSDSVRCSKLVEQVHELQHIYEVGKYASRHIKATKCALSLLGICSDHMAEPFNHFLAPERARVRKILESLELGDSPTLLD